MNKLKQLLQNVLTAVACALVFLPIMWTSFTGQDLSEMTRHILLSGGIVSVIAVLLLGLEKENKKAFVTKIGCCAILLVLLILQWI